MLALRHAGIPLKEMRVAVRYSCPFRRANLLVTVRRARTDTSATRKEDFSSSGMKICALIQGRLVAIAMHLSLLRLHCEG